VFYRTLVPELRRPYIRNSTRTAVEAASPRTVGGRFIDANTRLPIEGKYDLGHKPGFEFWRERLKAQAEGLTQSQFNDRMNNLKSISDWGPVLQQKSFVWVTLNQKRLNYGKNK